MAQVLVCLGDVCGSEHLKVATLFPKCPETNAATSPAVSS